MISGAELVRARRARRPGRSLTLGRAAVAVGTGALALVIALAIGPPPLFVLAAGLLLVGLAAPCWTLLTARGASVHRTLHGGRVVEGQALAATVELRGGWLGLPIGELRDPLAGEHVRIPRKRRADIRVVARFERRGLRTLAPPSLSISDPLELSATVRTSSQPPQEVLVLPRTEPVRAASSAAARAIGLAGASSEALAAVELDGLRAYTPGTPASRIHWPALARGAGLLERKLRVAGDMAPLVVLDARGPEPLGVHCERLDAAVRAAASLALSLAAERGCRLLLPGERRAHEISRDLIAWPAAHTRLAVVEGGPRARAPSPGALQGALGPLFYVAPVRLDRLPSTLRPGPGRPTVLVAPAELASPAPGVPVLSVAGCVGFLVGSRAARPGEKRARVPLVFSGSGSERRP